ncbi:MAG: MarR family transcriptional regulator [Bdellovibrionales bacterium]|nr:MarR family transcriptional regulator [Bdellovibrionales bacterium]
MAQEKKNAPPSEEHVFLRILEMHATLSSAVNDFFKARDVSYPQFRVLQVLRASDSHNLPILSIAHYLVTREPDISRLVDRLEASGYVKRTRSSEDRRMVLVGLTKKGEKIVSDTLDPLRRFYRRQFQHLTASELKQLDKLLLRIGDTNALRANS